MPFKKLDSSRWVPDNPVYPLGTAFSVGDWNINPGGNRFVAPRRRELTLAGKARLIKRAGGTHMEFHSTEAPRSQAKEINRIIREEGLVGTHMVTANLFRLDCYTNGNLGDANLEVRKAAIADTKDYIAAGVEDFGAAVYVYWNSSNGTNTRLGVNYQKLYQWTADSIAEIVAWMVDTYGPEKSLAFAIESKPNEPRVWSLPANIGEALAIRSLLPKDLQDFVGVNPEVGHACMAGVNYPAELGLAAACGALFHVHLNGAPEYPMWDVDAAFGDLNFGLALETVSTLDEIGFNGVVGLDVQPFSTDTNEQQAASIERSIRNFRRAQACCRLISKKVLKEHRENGDNASIAEIFAQVLTKDATGTSWAT